MKYYLLYFFLFTASTTLACPVCDRNKPAVLKGISHGVGADNSWDYLIVGAIAGVVLITLFYSIKWLIRPGESSENHIKRMVLKEL